MDECVEGVYALLCVEREINRVNMDILMCKSPPSLLYPHGILGANYLYFFFFVRGIIFVTRVVRAIDFSFELSQAIGQLVTRVVRAIDFSFELSQAIGQLVDNVIEAALLSLLSLLSLL